MFDTSHTFHHLIRTLTPKAAGRWWQPWLEVLVREAQSQLVSHAKLADKKAAALGYPRQDILTVMISSLLRTSTSKSEGYISTEVECNIVHPKTMRYHDRL